LGGAAIGGGGKPGLAVGGGGIGKLYCLLPREGNPIGAVVGALILGIKPSSSSSSSKKLSTLDFACVGA
jgi:hypothetical protein